MLKKLAFIGVAASIGFALVVLTPLPAMAGRPPVALSPFEVDTPTRDAPAEPNERVPSVPATKVKLAKPKLVKTKPTKSKPVKTKPAAPVASK